MHNVARLVVGFFAVASALQAERAWAARQTCGQLILDGAGSATFSCPVTTSSGGTGSMFFQFRDAGGDGAAFAHIEFGTGTPAFCVCKAAPPLKDPRFHQSRDFVCATQEEGVSSFVTGTVVGKGPTRVLARVQLLALTGLQTVATGKCRPVAAPPTPTPTGPPCGPNPGPTSCDH